MRRTYSKFNADDRKFNDDNDIVKLFTSVRENIRVEHTENAAVIGVKLKVCRLGDSVANRLDFKKSNAI